MDHKDDQEVKSKGVISGIFGGGGSATATVFKDAWSSGILYLKNNQVRSGNGLYLCTADHTSAGNTEPGVGQTWSSVWTEQFESLTLDQIAACDGTGTPSSTNVFVTSDDARLPTSSEKAALAGTGTPSGTNKYVTESTKGTKNAAVVIIENEAPNYHSLELLSKSAGTTISDSSTLVLRETSATVGNYTTIVNQNNAQVASAIIGFKNIDHAYAGAIEFWTRYDATHYGKRMEIDEYGAVDITGDITAGNITATPSASVIPIADSSGTLDGWVTVTPTVFDAHDHDGVDSPKVIWNNINRATSSIADIATRSHTVLSSIGTNTHAQLDSHVADGTKHRLINDAGTSTTETWSANKTNTAISAGITAVLSFENPVIDKDLSTPPAPVEGARYIVKPAGLVAWDTHDNAIAQYVTDAWVFTAATAGMTTYVTDENLLYLYNGSTWLPISQYILATAEPGVVSSLTSGTVGVSTKVAKEDHGHDLGQHDHDDAEINLDAIGGQVYSLCDRMSLESAGKISGGVITAGTDGVDISELHCLMKTSELDVTQVIYVVIPAANIPSTSLTDNAQNWICADYNDGTPLFYATTNRLGVSVNTEIVLGRVYSEDGDLDIFSSGVNLFNVARTHHDRLVLRGFERMSGAVFSEIGTRYMSVTPGIFYFGANRVDTAALDTSDGDTYERYVRDGRGGWTETDRTQSSNDVYDDGSGTPVAIPAGRYAARFVYLCLAGDLYVVDAQNHFSLSEAKAVEQPVSLPPYITSNAKLIAKYIVTPDEDHYVMTISGYEASLAGTIGVTSHQGLAGLQGGAVEDYYHITGTEHTALTTNLDETIQDIVGDMVDGGTETGLSLTYDDQNGKINAVITYGTGDNTACVGNDARLSDARASTWSTVSGKPTTFAPIIGSGATDAVAGNDARLTDARTPASHSLASHTTSGASDGKVITASSATEFGWEDPAITWSQVSGKPTTFAPIIGSGATDAVAGNDTRLTDARASTWATVSGKPTTFAPIIGSGATDAVAGNDARLTDARASTWETVSNKPTTFAPIIGSGAADAVAGNDARMTNARPSTWDTVANKPTTFAPIIGTGATDAVAGNDARLTDTRTPKSHTLSSHTTSGAVLGQILTATGETSFAWSDLVLPTWDQVSGKPTTFAPIIGSSATQAVAGNDARLTDNRIPTSHTLASHTTSGAGAGKLLTASSATEFGWSDPVHPTWSDVSSKPTTFAPIIGSGAADAVAGNDARLTDARTPVAHNHITTNLTDYTAPTSWTTDAVWTTTAPAGVVYVTRYTKIGKKVTFWLQASGSDGDARTPVSFTLPVTPSNVGMEIVCEAQQKVDTTWSKPIAYIKADTATESARLLQFHFVTACTNSRAYLLSVTGTYEVD